MRFLAEEAGVVRDLVWGDGVVFQRYAVTGARAVHARREGPKHVVWLGLPERPSKGERATVRSTRTIVDGFTEPDEYFELEVERPTRLLSLTLVFPESRPPRRASLSATPRVSGKRLLRTRWDLGPRPYLQVILKQPRPFTRYRVDWSW